MGPQQVTHHPAPGTGMSCPLWVEEEGNKQQKTADKVHQVNVQTPPSSKACSVPWMGLQSVARLQIWLRNTLSCVSFLKIYDTYLLD